MHFINSKLNTVVALIFISHLTFEVTPASPAHIHSINKERVEDGSFASRDHNHIVDGDHHSEFDHEAILGSVKEAQEYDNLSPEESKRRLRILLVKMDLNKDDHIDRNELRAWILRSFKMLTEEEASDRFEDADDNNDGRVTWEEYKNDAYGSDDDFEGGDTDAMLKQDKVMFEAADLDKDHYLDQTEFVLFSHPEESPEMLPHILRNTLDEKDINNDGEIDFQEYVGDKGKDRDKEWLVGEKDKFDNDYDKDKDGKLNTNEILSWVIPSNDEIAQEEVVHLFAAADENQDNILSFAEILENHEIFVGSEATDYGEHLHNIEDFKDEL